MEETPDGKTFESILKEHNVHSISLELDILRHFEQLRQHIAGHYDKMLDMAQSALPEREE